MITIRREFACLKATKRPALLEIQVWAVGVKPINRLTGYLVAMFVVAKGEVAMGDEIRKNERSRFLRRVNGRGYYRDRHFALEEVYERN